jgi:ubiquitin C-terminal hydrolase
LFVDNFILPIFDDLPKQKRKFETKTLQVGLNNLGSTCYLNSMLQVLNSVEPFRNALMLSSSQAPLLKEMQSLLSYLYFS